MKDYNSEKITLDKTAYYAIILEPHMKLKFANHKKVKGKYPGQCISCKGYFEKGNPWSACSEKCYNRDYNKRHPRIDISKWQENFK